MAHFKCIVGGEFYKKEAGGKTMGMYEVVANVPILPNPDATDTHYMTVIKKSILNKLIKAKYPGAIAYKTHEMYDRILVEDGKSDKHSPMPNIPSHPAKPGSRPPSKMNRNEIITYIETNEIPINLEVYDTVDKMKKAVASYGEDKQQFLEAQKKLVEELEMQKMMDALNPTTVETTEEPTPNESAEQPAE